MNEPRRLTGEELISRIREMPSASKSEKARACGYYALSEDGSERLCYTAFYAAIVDASGVDLDPPRRPKLPYRASVLTTGAILIGPRYAEQLGLGPGDRVSLEIKRGRILVSPA